jgi:hypothetical protein
MVLEFMPKVVYTELTSTIGQPEDYLMMIHNFDKIFSERVDASIPDNAVILPFENLIAETDNITDFKDLNDKNGRVKLKARVTKKRETKCKNGVEIQHILLIDKNGNEIEAFIYGGNIAEKSGTLNEKKVKGKNTDRFI